MNTLKRKTLQLLALSLALIALAAVSQAADVPEEASRKSGGEDGSQTVRSGAQPFPRFTREVDDSRLWWQGKGGEGSWDGESNPVSRLVNAVQLRLGITPATNPSWLGDPPAENSSTFREQLFRLPQRAMDRAGEPRLALA